MAGLGGWCWRILGCGLFGASLGSADDRDSELEEAICGRRDRQLSRDVGVYIPYSVGRSCQNGKTRLDRDRGSRQCRRRSPSGARAVLSVIVLGEVPAPEGPTRGFTEP